MSYCVWGSGPPLVLVHGMAEHARGFVLLMHQLKSRYTCVGYELPDGLTDGSHLKTYTLNHYAGDLIELFDYLSLDSVALLGSSFGSLIALASMARYPERNSRGILQGGFAHRPLSRWERSLARSARYWPGWFADWPAIHHPVLKWMAQPTAAMLPPKVSQFFLVNGGQTPIQAAALRSLTIDSTNLVPILPTIRQPLLLIGGDCDPLVPLSCEREIERTVPNAQRHEFAGCGHFPQYTHPRPMAEVIDQFLSGSTNHQ